MARCEPEVAAARTLLKHCLLTYVVMPSFLCPRYVLNSTFVPLNFVCHILTFTGTV